jgi:DNA-binding response OmpR family regulator
MLAAAATMNERAVSDTVEGTETVLVVEDETPVRELIRDVLRLHGYTVLEARDGVEAAALADAHPGPIHLVIVDVVLPRLGSSQLIEHIRARRPDVRTLHTSGHTDELLRRNGVVRIGPDFLQKPFTLEALARKVRQVLDAAA